MSKQNKTINSLRESHSQNRSRYPQPTSPDTSSVNCSSSTKAQNHPIDKIYSSSLLKKKSLKTIKDTSPLQKPPPNPNVIKSLKVLSTLKKKPLLTNLDNLPSISKLTTSSSRCLTPNTLRETPLKKEQNFSLLFEKYEMYKGIFEEVIQKDKTFSVILRKIKDIYEEFYETSISANTNKLKQKTQSLNEELKSKSEEMLILDKRIRKLSSENYELARSLERSEKICTEVQSRLSKISKFSIDQIEKSDETWKALLIENEAFSISFKNLRKKIRVLKETEKKLKQILIGLKKAGFPVEEFCEKTIDPESESFSSDSFFLVSDSFQEIEKPLAVPELDLRRIGSGSSNLNDSYLSSI